MTKPNWHGYIFWRNGQRPVDAYVCVVTQSPTPWDIGQFVKIKLNHVSSAQFRYFALYAPLGDTDLPHFQSWAQQLHDTTLGLF